MRPKLKPIKPANKINELLYDTILKKQNGDDKLAVICKKNGMYIGTFRRVLETKDSWTQAILLYNLCDYLGLDIKNVIETGVKSKMSQKKSKHTNYKTSKRKN
ncbi:MAG: hypothetical protein EHM58_00040 [Ignavibacteriae bacterium]|nr:MAG: hypothetical protein EHM58_00040 [Ignavibacteriota bacterium]